MASQKEPETCSNISALVRETFRTVWKEFYDWERGHSQRVRASVARPLPRNGFRSALDSCTRSAQTGAEKLMSVREMASALANLDVDTPLDVVHLPLFEPYPDYEACAPLHKSIWRGDDPDEMPFVPNADDPTFDSVRHSSCYSTLSWNSNSCQKDPNVETIILEVMKRLYYQHHVSLADIDRTGVLPIRLLPGDASDPGLLHSVHQRDLVDWPGASKLPIPSLHVPDATDLGARLHSSLSLFCGNPNCIHSLCNFHESLPPPFLEPSPRLASQVFFDEVKDPCGERCFLTTTATTSEAVWPEADIATLRTILSVMPDAAPCDLAVLAQKACCEVFSQRQILIKDDTIQPSEEKLRARTKKSLDFTYHPDRYIPTDPCSHRGRCDTANADCPCALNKAHCERGCRCDVSCVRRWRGCRCTHRCAAERCPCFRAHRECDVDICHKRDEKRTESGSAQGEGCQNVAIQQGHHKLTEVKRGEWGLGLFICEPTEKGDLIVEYVGELILEPTVESRADLAMHRGRNYAFGLNGEATIDATRAGNSARFINHVERNDPRCNARAIVRLVYGDHRIGIFASKHIESGEEILLYYGPNFFDEDDEGGDDDGDDVDSTYMVKSSGKGKQKSTTSRKRRRT